MSDAPNKTPYIGLARRYRPQSFADMVGQDQVAHSLEQQVLQGKVAQAYIFSGPRGTGKTSSARILAKGLNCAEGPTVHPCGKCEHCLGIANGISMDVIEIDGASNNGVEDIRNLQESISQNPFSARKKIYIIDEVHMLSKSAFNALLKTLEEPPPFVIFIFATTEYEKIPETIKSRCQTFAFRRISLEDIIRRLDYVATKEAIAMEPSERDAILETIAFAVDGGLRDAMMALDQIAALSEGLVRLDETVRFLGVVEHDLLIQTVEQLYKRDTRGLLEMVNGLVERGRDLERFVKNLLGFLRDLMVLKAGGNEELVHLTGAKLERAKALLWQRDEAGRAIEALSYPALLNSIQIFMGLEARIKEAVQVRIHLEFAFVKLTAIEPVVDIAKLLEHMNQAPRAAAPQPVAPAPMPAPRPVASPPPQPGTPDLFKRGAAQPAPQPMPVAQPVPPPAPQPVPQPVASQPVPQPQPVAAAPVPPPANLSPEQVWQALLGARQQMGLAVSMALAECHLIGLSNNNIQIGYLRSSLSAPALQKPENLAKVERAVRHFSQGAWGVQANQVSNLPSAPNVPPPPTSSRNTPEEPYAAAAMPALPPLPPEPMRQQAQPREEELLLFREREVPNVNPDENDEEEEAPGHSIQKAYQSFLRQNPVRRLQDALQNDPVFREKLDMARRFFDGTLADAEGNPVAL